MKNALGLFGLQGLAIAGSLFLGVPSVVAYTAVVLAVAALAIYVASTRPEAARTPLHLFAAGAALTAVGEVFTVSGTPNSLHVVGGVAGSLGYLLMGISLFLIGRQNARGRVAGTARVSAILDALVVTIAFVTVILALHIVPFFVESDAIRVYHVTDAAFFTTALLIAFPLLYLTFVTEAFSPVNALFVVEVLLVATGAATGSWVGNPDTVPLEARHAFLMMFWVIAAVILARARVAPITPGASSTVQSLSPVRFLVLFSGMITIPLLLLFTGATTTTASAMYAVALILMAGVVMARIMIAVNALNQRHSALKRQVDIDPLTGLLTRSAFLSRAEGMTAKAMEAGDTVSVVFIDLSDFKAVNDTHGHAVGDALLAQVGKRLRGTMRDSDAACRFGGDEFALIAVDDVGGIGGERLAERAFGLFSSAFEVNGSLSYTRAAIGLANTTQIDTTTGKTLTTLIAAADEAMYDSKREGSMHWRRYKPGAHLYEVEGARENLAMNPFGDVAPPHHLRASRH